MYIMVSYKHNLTVAYLINLTEKCHGYITCKPALDTYLGCKTHVAGEHILFLQHKRMQQTNTIFLAKVPF